MSRPAADILRDALPAPAGPVLNYARPPGPAAERRRMTPGQILAALFFAGLAFAGTLVVGAIAGSVALDISNPVRIPAMLAGVSFAANFFAILVFLTALQSFGSAVPARTAEPDSQA